MPQRDHTKLLCDISEISGLFSDIQNLENFLQRIVELLALHMASDICSIYLYYENTGELVLSASKGLTPDSIGRIKLKLGEGLTGLALKELRPICVKQASRTPGYRHFPGSGEDNFESFLAIPIIRGHTRIGVLVIQKKTKNYFQQHDINAFSAITSQLANTIETTKLLMSLKQDVAQTDKVEKAADVEEIKFVKGRVGSSGCAFGPSVHVDRREWHDVIPVGFTGSAYKEKDLFKAIETVEHQLNNWQVALEQKLSDVASLIFSAQILMLNDKNFIESILSNYQRSGDLIAAVIQTVEYYSQLFDSSPHVYLREKKQDVFDIGRLLLESLTTRYQNPNHYQNKIIIAQDLFSSELLKYTSQGIKGVIVLSGGITGHVAILCRSLDIPLIISKEMHLLDLPPETPLLLDGDQGNIYIKPSQEVIQEFRSKSEDHRKATEIKQRIKDKTYTRDHRLIHLLANINLLSDLQTARMVKAEGIGLYRTEFPFIIRANFPTEEEQIWVYQKLIAGMSDKEITFRTLDIGGDKVLSYYDYGIENNPFLGMRSIRFSLRHQDVFRQQLKAILRAGYKAQLRIMFPMISSLDEFIEAKQIVFETIEELKQNKVKYHPQPAIGMMVELPSVLGILEDLAQEADFFSVGTNDFIQYMLAVDRTNEKVADLYVPHHPSILRALKQILDVGNKFNKDISICGDMAHDTRYMEFLIGIGFRKLSLDPRFLPKIQQHIQTIDYKKAQRKAQKILKHNSLAEIKKLLLGNN